MEERLVRKRSTGLNATGLRTWGMMFLVLAAAGRCLLQNQLLGATGGMEQLMEALNRENGMVIASAALVLQAVESCAAPVFCFLLVEGVQHTSNFGKYLIRVLLLALVTEIPYNLAMSGQIFDTSCRNPVFGMALSLILIYFYRTYASKSAKNIFIKVIVTIAAFLWAQMLRIESGACCIILVSVLWAFRNKPTFRNLAGCVAAVVCTLFSPFYLAAPMGFLAVYFYNGEKGSSSPVVNYLMYPVALLIIGLIGIFVM